MEEAERISRDEHGSHKLSVISGVGTRNYYRKLGYEIDGPYMSKNLEWFVVHTYFLFKYILKNVIA